MSDTQRITFDSPFVTEEGEAIPFPTVAYQSWGSLNEERDNVVLVCHALTGNTAVDDWFGGLFGPGRPLDPDKHFIVCPNVLGSCYGSSGPLSIHPEIRKSYRARFPKVTIRDMVRLQQQLLNELEVTGIEMVIGGSMGGMQALEWCIMDERPRAGVLIGMGKQHQPWAIGISHTQRQAIYNDPNWSGGFYSDEHPPKQGLALARMIAMNSYRHPVDFEKKFARRLQGEGVQFEVESYLNYQGKKLTGRFDAVSYVRLTQAMDSHDVARGRSGAAEVLQSVQIPMRVVGIDNDLLYPPEECRELSELLPHATYHELKSPYGHDAFLIEFEQLRSIVQPLTTPKTSLAAEQ